MPERVRKCPNCGGNLEASRFARSVPCAFCGSVVLLDPSVVEIARYRDAHAVWVDPDAQGYSHASWLGGAAWVIGPLLARGGITDVHLAVRARTPSEIVLARIVRDSTDAPRLARTWDTLQRLRTSPAPGAAVMAGRVPEPVAHGLLDAGPAGGRAALLVRPAHGYTATLASVRRPIDPRASVWVWRRVLEALAFVHASGLVHGALSAEHVLVEAGEHGARLVGFGSAVAATPSGIRDDLRATARTILHAIGGDPTRGTADVPGPYAAVLRAVATDGVTPHGDRDAWALRERLGAVGRAAFGAPGFFPILPRR